ncbi:erythronate-4-phosphate dehydrogenase [Hydrogenovibrio sp. SC-1]|uniref:4-phosphoerythronate dehydrogenase n=1 Tax=Hydrogenovibrio sp. SC-1 TaxID=2065820 RepID=UPI000C7A6B0F|nr:4-phosphoerythronate dehydrogenase [Hydrogenovibrio sp. SC-1]PLA75053.1 erythronate-4-phosphate dehydrogenase [Hydrogenovibrio sp. SC-1]
MNHPNKTLVIDDAIPYAEAIFSPLGQVILRPGREITRQDLQNADALIVRSRTQVNAKLLEGTSISFVGSTVVGLDHIDQPYLRRKGIPFYSAQGCNANSVAEYIITNLVNLAYTKEFSLASKTLGIIGVGHVGQGVAQKAQALGMKCLLNDPPRQRHTGDTGFVDLETALTADIITVHTPLTTQYEAGSDATVDLISEERLRHITPQQILINAARGGIINEAQWCQTPTLVNIIDCWENEPNISQELYNVANIATPHIAGHSLDAKIAGSEMVYQSLCNHWQISPSQLWRSHLPSAPDPIKIDFSGHLETDLYQTLRHCYRPEEDDLALRSGLTEDFESNYESYRRHYPLRREWHQHSLYKSPSKKFDQTLHHLGFEHFMTP